MIPVNIPDFGCLQLSHIVSDYNGTLAVDGRLIKGVAARLRALANRIAIHVITADTFGLASTQLARLPLTLTITPPANQAAAKLAYVKKLGADSVVAIGNGRNDRQILQAAAIGIALLQKEGASAETIRHADILSGDILDALDLLNHPQRLTATLKS
jgi:soluble P-type ATPase